MSDEAVTRDAVLGGTLSLHQPARGWRFSVDAVLLARFAAAEERARGAAPRRAADVGAGCGVVGLAALRLGAVSGITMFEIDPLLAALARENARINGFDERARVVTGDVSAANEDGMFDVILSNPPWLPVGCGDLPAHPQRARARFTVTLDARRVLDWAARRLAPGGRAYLVGPRAMFDALGATQLAPAVMRDVQPTAGAPPVFRLVAWAHDPGPRAVRPPLVLFDGPPTPAGTPYARAYAAEAARLLGP